MFIKNFMGGGGNFHGRKLTPENACQEIRPPSPKEKKKKKKENGRSYRRTERVSRTVLDSELKLYLLISILNVISRDANFEKLNTGKM